MWEALFEDGQVRNLLAVPLLLLPTLLLELTLVNEASSGGTAVVGIGSDLTVTFSLEENLCVDMLVIPKKSLQMKTESPLKYLHS